MCGKAKQKKKTSQSKAGKQKHYQSSRSRITDNVDQSSKVGRKWGCFFGPALHTRNTETTSN